MCYVEILTPVACVRESIFVARKQHCVLKGTVIAKASTCSVKHNKHNIRSRQEQVRCDMKERVCV